MLINLLGDFRIESGLETILNKIYRRGFRTYFIGKDYGSSIKTIAVIPVCQDPGLRLKQRKRFSKADKTLYLDIMFNLPVMVEASESEREKIFIDKFLHEVPAEIVKYKFDDFDNNRFKKDCC